MHDVIKGGSTIFPQLNIALKPEKGTALVWFDDIQQESNDIIRHAICSSIIGHNWSKTRKKFTTTIIIKKPACFLKTKFRLFAAFIKRIFEKRKPRRMCG